MLIRRGESEKRIRKLMRKLVKGFQEHRKSKKADDKVEVSKKRFKKK